MYLSEFATGFFQFNICFVFMSFLLNCHCSICPSEKKHIVTDTLKQMGSFKAKWKNTRLPILAVFWFYKQVVLIHSVKIKGLL